MLWWQAELAGMQLQSNPCLDRKSLGNGIIKPKVGRFTEPKRREPATIPTITIPQPTCVQSQARQFAVGKALGVLRWRCATKDEELMPLSSTRLFRGFPG